MLLQAWSTFGLKPWEWPLDRGPDDRLLMRDVTAVVMNCRAELAISRARAQRDES